MKKGTVIWMTGLPCSGKTTIAKEVESCFKEHGLPVQRLDGDVVRKTLSKGLGYSKIDRDKNIQRMAYVCQMLSDNGVNVVCAFVSPYRTMRNFARSLCGDFVEVYVRCSIDECRRRDTKGMYALAERGELKDFTGVQSPYEVPEKPEIIIDSDRKDIFSCVQEIINYLEK